MSGSGTTGAGPVMDIYGRLSFAPNGDTINVDDQVEWCSDAVVERGGVLGEVFKDNSLSAWKPTVRRPEWEALMHRLEAGESDGVMVLDLTRFSRKVMEGERLVDLAGRGVRVWSLAGSYDLTTADGRRHFRESMVAAAAESDKISERVKRGKLRRARRGRMHGGQRGFALPGFVPAPSGWEPGDPREPVSYDRVQSLSRRSVDLAVRTETSLAIDRLWAVVEILPDDRGTASETKTHLTERLLAPRPD